MSGTPPSGPTPIPTQVRAPIRTVVRPLERADADASRRLGQEAFGVYGDLPPVPDPWPPAGDHMLGAFDGDHPHGDVGDDHVRDTVGESRLIGRVVARSYRSHFAGVQIPTCGIAGVAVQAEDRGRGTLGGLFEATFAAAGERGEVISTLFPTAPRIYRKFGYELVGALDRIELPTAALAGLTAPQGISVRRATVDDMPEVRSTYAQWALWQHGPLTRTGPSFTATDAELAAEFTGITVARDDRGEVVGYASWDRGAGYDDAASLVVEDLIALTPTAAQALWAVFGSFSSVTGHVRLQTSGHDTVRLVLPAVAWKQVKTSPYMLAVLDVAAAFSARTGPAAVAATLDFAVEGHLSGDQNGAYSLHAEYGTLVCRRGGAGGRTLTPQGLALTYAGTQSGANLRAAGHLSGGDPGDDATWDALFGGRQFHIRDYF